jgi:hypothetical protein
MQKFALAVVLVASLGGARSAAAQASVAERLAQEIRAALPGAVVTNPEPGGIDITFAGLTRSLGIESLLNTCAASADKCQAATNSYAQRAASYMLEALPLERDQLRIYVRSRSYLTHLGAQTGSSALFVAEPLAGDLVSVCYRDLPRGRRPITPEDVVALDIADTVLTYCKEQSHRLLPDLAGQWKELPVNGIGYIKTGDDVTGYLSVPERWRPLAERLGSLIVAIPATDTLLYAQGKSVVDVDALAALAEQVHGRASIPVSALVLRWTDQGWVPVERP